MGFARTLAKVCHSGGQRQAGIGGSLSRLKSLASVKNHRYGMDKFGFVVPALALMSWTTSCAAGGMMGEVR
jgi:hypothetical protein